MIKLLEISKKYCFKNLLQSKQKTSDFKPTPVKIKINTAYCDKFLGNTPRNLIYNNIFSTMLCEELSIATRFDLVQEFHQATCTKKKALQYTTKIILIFQSRMHSKTAQQNTVKVPAAQFKITYCPS